MKTRLELIEAFKSASKYINDAKHVTDFEKIKGLDAIMTILDCIYKSSEEYLSIKWTMKFERMLIKLNKMEEII